MDHRPSDLDPYPRVGRDLAALDLWEGSLERSRQRRRLLAASRSHRQRRKGTSLAVGAAMLAAPVVPAFAGVVAWRRQRSGARGRARHLVGRRRDGRADAVARLRRRRARGRRDPEAGRRHRRRDLRPDHAGRGRALPARPFPRRDRRRRRPHLGGAVQRARAVLRRAGRVAGDRHAGERDRAARGRPARVGRVVRGRCGGGRLGRGPGAGVRARGEAGPGAVVGAGRPAGGRLHGRPDRRAGPGHGDRPLRGRAAPVTPTRARTSRPRAAPRSTRPSAGRSCSRAPSRATA